MIYIVLGAVLLVCGLVGLNALGGWGPWRPRLWMAFKQTAGILAGAAFFMLCMGLIAYGATRG